MDEAYAAASSNGQYPIISQQVFYKARPKILKLTGKKELKDKERSRFCYVLLPLFMLENPELTRDWRVLYKPRGELIEPHTRLRVGLGTAEVAHYQNLLDQRLRARRHGSLRAGLAGRDARPAPPLWGRGRGREGRHRRPAAPGGPAQPARRRHHRQRGSERRGRAGAGRRLRGCRRSALPADRFRPPRLHHRRELARGDLAPSLSEQRRGFHVGLRLEQINSLGGLASKAPGGLEDEPIGKNTLEHVSDDRLRECGATEEEIALLRSRRVELNALTTEQLVNLVEGALAEHGIAKVIPDSEALEAAWRSAKAHAEIAEAVEQANRRAERWQAEPVPEGLVDRVRELLKRHPAKSWDAVLREIVEAPAR